MGRGVFLFWNILLVAVCFTPRVAEAAPPPAFEKAWVKIEKPGPNLGSRDIMGFILEAAGGPDFAQNRLRIDEALQKLERMQDRDPASKTYGNFCWYWHETRPGDLNAAEFITQQAVLLRMRYAGRLSPGARAAWTACSRLRSRAFTGTGSMPGTPIST